MGDEISRVIEYAGLVGGAFSVSVAAWAVILRWAPAARSRGGQWELEALLFAIGPATATVTSLYPADDGHSVFANANRVLVDVAYVLATVAIIRGIRNRRRRPVGLLVAFSAYYLALFASCLAGVVPGMVEAYWATPLIVFAFLLHDGCTFEWLTQVARLVLRTVVILSFLSIVLMPNIAFNTEEARTVFGISRLQGITSHPNTLGILAVLGFLLELRVRSRVWKFAMILALVLAHSSTAYVAFAVGVLIVAHKRVAVIRVLALVATVVAILVTLLDSDVSKAVAYFLSEDGIVQALNGRTAIWEATLYGFYSNPVFGYGPTLLDESYRQMYLGDLSFAAQAHNQWYQTLGDSGLIGMGALVVLSVVLWIYATRNRRSTSGFTLGAVAILFIRSVSETPLRPAGASLITLFLVVIVGALATAQKPSSGSFSTPISVPDGRRPSIAADVTTSVRI